MYISIKSITIFLAIVLTGLSAGLFYAWSVSVIPGTKKLMNLTYLETMQSINRAILNPAFFLIFFGSLLMLTISTIQEKGQPGLTFWFLLSATILYLLGTFGVTAFGNIPLNNSLDTLTLKDLDADQIAQFRKNYENQWNNFHLIRTVFAILSFLLSLLSTFTQNKFL